ncbi:nucleotide pyrophosphohydrolase [Vogesella sp. LIG4]|uniref:nucleotide pyrophosphohydrolase n=1 Tax=Vogesella sp. LIG4 TaxID=1192162 RepID=UPI00081FF3D0|nr:nucleotide pyrophosphohydrolase [Vogesella sp. LIG4]SCK12488.1 NTP pyrophosphatase, house-cleaning of non-canonical NTPs [Vogesella sp. LIG4]
MSRLVDVDGLIAAQRDFAAERSWQPYHTPRNLMLALAGEVGELAEIFQWKTDAEAAQLAGNPAEYTHLQEELADVLMYLVRLADVCQVDLDAAVADKLRKNARKYPPPAG